MMEERYHATIQNRFCPDMSNVNKNITVDAKLISPPTYISIYMLVLLVQLFMYRVIFMLVVVDMQCKGRLVAISVYVSMMFARFSFELPFTI